jgi:hypothetical protein
MPVLLIGLLLVLAPAASAEVSAADRAVAARHGLDANDLDAALSPVLARLDGALADLRNPSQPAAAAAETAKAFAEMHSQFQARAAAVSALRDDPAVSPGFRTAVVQSWARLRTQETLIAAIATSRLAEFKALAARQQQGSATDADRALLRALSESLPQALARSRKDMERFGSRIGDGEQQFQALFEKVDQDFASALAAVAEPSGPESASGAKPPSRGDAKAASAADGAPGPSKPPPVAAVGTGPKRDLGDEQLGAMWDQNAVGRSKEVAPKPNDASMQGSFKPPVASAGSAGSGAGSAAIEYAQPKSLKPDGVAVPALEPAAAPDPRSARHGPSACAALLGLSALPLDAVSEPAAAELSRCDKKAALAELPARRAEARAALDALVERARLLLEAQRADLAGDAAALARLEPLLAELAAIGQESEPKRGERLMDWLGRAHRYARGAGAGFLGQARAASRAQEEAAKRYSASARALLGSRAFRKLAAADKEKAALVSRFLAGDDLDEAERAAAEAAVAELAQDSAFAAALERFREGRAALEQAIAAAEGAVRPEMAAFEQQLGAYRAAQLAYLQVVAVADSHRAYSGEKIFLGLPDAEYAEVSHRFGRQGLTLRTSFGAAKFVSNDGLLTGSWSSTCSARAPRPACRPSRSRRTSSWCCTAATPRTRSR